MVGPVPFRTPFCDLSRLRVQAWDMIDVWVRWLTDLRSGVNASPQLLGTLTKTAQTAALAATSVPTQTLTAGLYRVSWYLRIATPATVSSSLTPTLAWTDGGVACSSSGAAIVGNTTSTTQSGSLLIRLDQNTAIQFSAAYASVGAQGMLWNGDVTVEAIKI